MMDDNQFIPVIKSVHARIANHTSMYGNMKPALLVYTDDVKDKISLEISSKTNVGDKKLIKLAYYGHNYIFYNSPKRTGYAMHTLQTRLPIHVLPIDAKTIMIATPNYIFPKDYKFWDNTFRKLDGSVTINLPKTFTGEIAFMRVYNRQQKEYSIICDIMCYNGNTGYKESVRGVTEVDINFSE